VEPGVQIEFARLEQRLDRIDNTLDRIESRLDSYMERTARLEESYKSTSGQIKIIFSLIVAAVGTAATFILQLMGKN
jgi:adenylate kinase family enzyme